MTLLITQIVATLSQPGAGTSYSVKALSEALARVRLDVRVRSVEGWATAAAVAAPRGVEAVASPIGRDPLARYICSSPALRRALCEDAARGRILHTHGLWLMPNVYPYWAAAGRTGPTRLVLSPRGMLGAAALRFSATKKRLFWAGLQRAAIRGAHCLHATAVSEYEDIRARGLGNPVAIIPNGVDVPERVDTTRGDSREKIALSLGRLHPKKNLEGLLRAWAQVEAAFPDWRLKIMGPAEHDHDKTLIALARQLGLKRAAILGPVYGDDRAKTYSEADLFVLPTLNENFAMTVAEALAFGMPVISTKGAPWSGLETERCGWWIDHGQEAMTRALVEAMDLTDVTRAEMGERGRAWMRRDFSWDRIASDMADVYRWLQQGGAPPETVRLS